jgi:hypothetical protein
VVQVCQAGPEITDDRRDGVTREAAARREPTHLTDGRQLPQDGSGRRGHTTKAMASRGRQSPGLLLEQSQHPLRALGRPSAMSPPVSFPRVGGEHTPRSSPAFRRLGPPFSGSAPGPSSTLAEQPARSRAPSRTATINRRSRASAEGVRRRPPTASRYPTLPDTLVEGRRGWIRLRTTPRGARFVLVAPAATGGRYRRCRDDCHRHRTAGSRASATRSRPVVMITARSRQTSRSSRHARQRYDAVAAGLARPVVCANCERHRHRLFRVSRAG